MAFSKTLLLAILPAFVAAQNLPIQGTAGISSCNLDTAGPRAVCELRTSPTTTVYSECVFDPQIGGVNGQCGYAGSRCTVDDECQTNGSCLFDRADPDFGKCRGYFGDPCGEFLGCLGFLSCGTEVDQGAEFPSCGGKGAFCTVDDQCASGTCNNGACAESFSRSVGSPCGIVAVDNGLNGGYCGVGLTCDADTNSCQPSPATPTQEVRRRAIKERMQSEKRAANAVF